MYLHRVLLIWNKLSLHQIFVYLKNYEIKYYIIRTVRRVRFNIKQNPSIIQPTGLFNYNHS